MGVIVKIERDTFKILDNSGNIVVTTLQEIGRKRSSKDVESFDSHQNKITASDVVKVIDGPYKVCRLPYCSNI